jgi:hypothetical protein
MILVNIRKRVMLKNFYVFLRSDYCISSDLYSIVVGLGTMINARRSRDRFPTRLLHFFNLNNLFSRNMALELTRPLTELSTRNLRGRG